MKYIMRNRWSGAKQEASENAKNKMLKGRKDKHGDPVWEVYLEVEEIEQEPEKEPEPEVEEKPPAPKKKVLKKKPANKVAKKVDDV